MTRTRQILFIQGGGAGAHDEWDDKLVESLRRELGGEYEVRYPRMPDEGDPSYARWSEAIRREMADLDDGAVVAGHSVGAAILVNALAEQPPERGLRAIVLIAAPFVGEGGWPSDEFGLTSDLGARLPPGVRVHVLHGLQDETAPPSHADLYAWAIPQAQVHQLPGRDHQLNNDLSEVAEAVRINRPRGSNPMQMRLELIPLPVSDVDRAIAFYADKLGFKKDVDVQPSEGVRVVQLTPEGSGCSVGFGTGLDVYAGEPGSVRGLHLVVEDITEARAELVRRGVEISEIQDFGGGVKGADFSDPDGNTFELQEMAWRKGAKY